MTSRSLCALALLASLAALTGCGPEEVVTGPVPLGHMSSPIVGGTTDNGHPAVVLIYNSTGFLCTGEVIAPRIVLTAGHCTIEGETTPSPTLPPSTFQVGGGTDPINAATWIAGVVKVDNHPSLFLGSEIHHDVGILVLDQDAPVSPLSYQGVRDDSVYQVGTNFTAVGYGITGAANNDAGIKRTVPLQIQVEGSDAFQYGSASQNTCSGDSGGPALIGSKVIGTVSYGDQNCSIAGVDMRTDDNASFIKKYANDDGTAASGGGSKNNACGCSLDEGTGALGSLGGLITGLGALAAAIRRRRSA
jgi:V8-like Glu-specific endopeptidase